MGAVSNSATTPLSLNRGPFFHLRYCVVEADAATGKQSRPVRIRIVKEPPACRYRPVDLEEVAQAGIMATPHHVVRYVVAAQDDTLRDAFDGKLGRVRWCRRLSMILPASIAALSG